MRTAFRNRGRRGLASSAWWCATAQCFAGLLHVAQQILSADAADPTLPSKCSGKFVGNFKDAVGGYGDGAPKTGRVMPVATPCGGGPKKNPKPCPTCASDGKDWAIMDPKIQCPSTPNACSGCPGSLKPQTCMGACNMFGKFRYAGVEDGTQCFCGDALPSQKADPKAKLVACKGDAKQMCGGADIIGVYEVTCIGGTGADSTGAEAAANGTYGWGLTFVILLAATTYFGGGTAWNMVIKGATSYHEALPHRPMWLNLYGLVMDGAQFSGAKVGLKVGDHISGAQEGDSIDFAGDEYQPHSLLEGKPATGRKKRRSKGSPIKNISPTKKGSPTNKRNSLGSNDGSPPGARGRTKKKRSPGAAAAVVLGVDKSTRRGSRAKRGSSSTGLLDAEAKE